jgi:hypothetical protein
VDAVLATKLSKNWLQTYLLAHKKNSRLYHMLLSKLVTMLTHITFVLDSSGSMSSIKDDTVGGFNSFLEDQRDAEGDATVSLYDFNTGVDLRYETYPIADAPKLTDGNYTPGGRTALHDAIYMGITETAEWINETEASERPDNVIVVVLTDGKENASETHHERVREQVEVRREEYDWEFFFIGANQDAALTAEEMGMDSDRSLNMAHSGDGAQAAYESTSEQIHEARQTGQTSGYDEADRARQDDARSK